MDFSFFWFGPSIENDAIPNTFLPAHPEALAKTASSLPVITGLNDMEGMILIGSKLFFIYLFKKVYIFNLLKTKENIIYKKCIRTKCHTNYL